MPKKGKIEASEKAKIIREYLSDRMSMTEAAKQAYSLSLGVKESGGFGLFVR